MSPVKPPGRDPSMPPNILLITIDDLSPLELGVANTPFLDSFRESWLNLRRAYVHPVCSPTRASMLTGLLPSVHGIGAPIPEGSTDELGVQFPSVARELQGLGYRTALFGKWHLTGRADGHDHPHSMGFDYYDGCLHNTGQSGSGHYDYTRTSNGQQFPETEYTTDIWTRSAHSWIGMRRAARPWFVQLAYHAPHAPYDAPPGWPDSTPTDNYYAAVEYLDSQIAFLVQRAPLENTLVVITSDNGTPSAVAPRGRKLIVKPTVFEGGINVPCYVGGWAVKPGLSRALVSAESWFPTFIEAAGGPKAKGSRLGTLTNHERGLEGLLCQRFSPNGQGARRRDLRAAVAARWKVRQEDGALTWARMPSEEEVPEELVPASTRKELMALLNKGN